MTFIVATNVVASRPPKRQPTERLLLVPILAFGSQKNSIQSKVFFAATASLGPLKQQRHSQNKWADCAVKPTRVCLDQMKLSYLALFF